METRDELPPAPRADTRAAATLATVLRRVGYDAPVVAAVLGGGHEDVGLFESRAAALPARLATAVRLFLLGREVTAAAARSALGAALDAAIALGVVERRGAVRATVRIVPHDVLLLASDLPAAAPAGEHVAAAHAPSLTLARLTVRARVARALDVGTGNGIQALLLARHADRVVATDVNERALRFTELNAALNGVTTIETRTGSWLAPVEGETFGAIACNPPYVISPGSGLLYRDAELRGDRLCERLVHDLPAHLAPGGSASVLVSWVPDEAAPPAPVRWASHAGADALVLVLHRETAAEAAAAWTEGDERARWLDYYAAEGIAEIAYGAAVLRRGSGPAWRSALELPGGPAGHASSHLERIFAARDLLAARAADGLALELAPDAELDGTRLALRGGLGLQARLDPDGAALVAQLASGAAPTPLDESGRELLHRLLELGFVVPRI